MDEIKPVAWAFGQDWSQFQADRQECRLLPNFYWGEDLSLSSDYAALYDQQAIDTLQAEVAEAWAAADSKAGWEWKKRAERAEAEADALRKALHDIEACTTCDAAMGISGAALNGEYK